LLTSVRSLKPVPPALRPQNTANTPQPQSAYQGLSADRPQTDPSVPHTQRAPGVHADLAAVIAAWPTLSADVRATILQLIATEEVG